MRRVASLVVFITIVSIYGGLSAFTLVSVMKNRQAISAFEDRNTAARAAVAARTAKDNQLLLEKVERVLKQQGKTQDRILRQLRQLFRAHDPANFPPPTTRESGSTREPPDRGNGPKDKDKKKKPKRPEEPCMLPDPVTGGCLL